MATPGAHVRSVEELAQFRAALAEFAELAKTSLGAMDMDIQRTLSWLESQAKHWQHQERKAEDAVIEATLNLRRKRMMRIGDRPADTTQEEVLLRRAKARHEFVVDRKEKTAHWLRALPEAVFEYEGPARQLASMLEQMIPRMSAVLGKKIELLEQYLQGGAS